MGFEGKMMKLAVLVCCLGVAVAVPQLGTQEDDIPQARSQEDIDEYRRYLETTKRSNVSLEDAMARNPLASAWENSGMFEGDILLTDEQIEDMVAEYAAGTPDTGRSALNRPYGLWPGRVIIWDFAPGYFNAYQQNQITAAFRHFNDRTCVRFRRRTNERVFVRVTGRPTGCYANVGHWRNHVHTLNLARGCLTNHFVIVHEWLHIVGFYHMHQAYNRYYYIWINWYNMNQSIRRAFYLHRRQERDMLRLPYEYASNQHYSAYAFSNNGRPTIGARRPGGQYMGHLRWLTGWDLLRVNRLYGCPGAWTSPVNAEDANKPASYGPQSEEEEQAWGAKILLEQNQERDQRLQQLKLEGFDQEQEQQEYEQELPLGEKEIFEEPSEIVEENINDETY